MSAFAADTGGATAIEYAMIGSLLSILIVAGATGIGAAIKIDFMNLLKAWK